MQDNVVVPTAFSELAALRLMPLAPKTSVMEITFVRPREILRKLPMNLPVGDRRSAPTARPHTSLRHPDLFWKEWPN